MTNNSLLSSLVGNTPMLKITDKIWAKAEFMNPSGSLKDRMAVNIINHAEKNNLLKKGDTIEMTVDKATITSIISNLSC